MKAPHDHNWVKWNVIEAYFPPTAPHGVCYSLCNFFVFLTFLSVKGRRRLSAFGEPVCLPSRSLAMICSLVMEGLRHLPSRAPVSPRANITFPTTVPGISCASQIPGKKNSFLFYAFLKKNDGKKRNKEANRESSAPWRPSVSNFTTALNVNTFFFFFPKLMLSWSGEPTVGSICGVFYGRFCF